MEKALQNKIPDLQDALLAAFHDSRFRGVLYEFSSGHSGWPVFIVHYERKNKYGLHGTFVVKIGEADWAVKEQEFYDSLPDDETRSPLLTHGHMSTSPMEGLAAVAYEVAFGAVIQPKTLMNILDEEKKSQQEARQQIETLARALVDWYLAERCLVRARPDECAALVRHMLTEKRAPNVWQKLGTCLSVWPAEPLHVLIEERRLPNPLAYETICARITLKPLCPICRIHGDLHTGNVIYAPTAEQVPRLIDFAESTPDGVPFFDLAYLEFDIIQHTLPVQDIKARGEWLALLDESMSGIRIERKISSWGAARTAEFLAPIREQVWRLQDAGGETYELAWWLATVAVGLNFARKGDETRPVRERLAGLLYAAYGLKRVLKMFEIKVLTTGGAVRVVPWPHLDGVPGESAPSEGFARQQSSPASLAEQAVRAATQISPGDSSAVQEPQFRLPAADQAAVEQRTENSSPLSPVEVVQEAPATQERVEPWSVPEADERRQELQAEVELFQRGGRIYQDRCRATVHTLRQLETFLHALQQRLHKDDFFRLLPSQNLLDALKDLLANVQTFHDGCPPVPTRKLSQANYDKECAAIARKLERLQTKLQEFLVSLT